MDLHCGEGKWGTAVLPWGHGNEDMISGIALDLQSSSSTTTRADEMQLSYPSQARPQIISRSSDVALLLPSETCPRTLMTAWSQSDEEEDQNEII